MHDDSVVDGEVVGGQTRDVPSPDLDRISETLRQGELVGAGDLVGLALRRPILSGLQPVTAGEGAQVSDDARWNEDVSDEIVVDELQVGCCFRPSRLLASQPADELLCSLQLFRAQVDLLAFVKIIYKKT